MGGALCIKPVEWRKQLARGRGRWQYEARPYSALSRVLPSVFAGRSGAGFAVQGLGQDGSCNNVRLTRPLRENGARPSGIIVR